MNTLLRKMPGSTPRIHVAICVTHTFDYMTSTFFDLMLSMQTKYAISMRRSNLLPIDRNRTELTVQSLQDPTVTHILYIDTDIVPNDKDFLNIMVSYDLPILGLLCTKKVPPYEPIIYKLDAPADECINGFWTNYPKGLVEVDCVGTGCLLVKREVFAKMKKPYFQFQSAYEQDLYQSEDIYFLQNARELGYKAFVDTEHTCKHYGIRGFGVEDFGPYKQEFLSKKENNSGKH